VLFVPQGRLKIARQFIAGQVAESNPSPVGTTELPILKPFSPLDAGMLILCDFDGTAVEQDFTNLVWDHHFTPAWREDLLPPYRAGKVTTLELMAQGYRGIRVPADELLAWARPRVNLRHGFENLQALCAARGWPFYVVSNGLNWYVEAFLPQGTPYRCYAARFDGCWHVTLPEGCALNTGEDFKVHMLRQLQRLHPGMPAAFIGDGRNDFPVAGQCESVFAVRETTLAKMCRETGRPCVEFESFDTVAAALIGS
jgi:HAD superfamily phosphoserine phosphatase-like hydrolase